MFKITTVSVEVICELPQRHTYTYTYIVTESKYYYLFNSLDQII